MIGSLISRSYSMDHLGTPKAAEPTPRSHAARCHASNVLYLGVSFQSADECAQCPALARQFSAQEPTDPWCERVLLGMIDSSTTTALGFAFNTSGKGISGSQPLDNYITRAIRLKLLVAGEHVFEGIQSTQKEVAVSGITESLDHVSRSLVAKDTGVRYYHGSKKYAYSRRGPWSPVAGSLRSRDKGYNCVMRTILSFWEMASRTCGWVLQRPHAPTR